MNAQATTLVRQSPGLAAYHKFRRAWGKEFDYGQVIPKDWMETAMGLSGDDISTAAETSFFRGQWMRAMGVFRECLLNEMKILIISHSETGGYYIVRPEEQTDYAIRSFAGDVSKAIRKSSEIADNTNVDKLTSEQKREAADQKALLRRMQAAVTTSMGHLVPRVYSGELPGE